MPDDLPGQYSDLRAQDYGSSGNPFDRVFVFGDMAIQNAAASVYARLATMAEQLNYAKQLAVNYVASILPSGGTAENVATPPGGSPEEAIQLDFADPELQAATKQLIETGFPLESENLAKAAEALAGSSEIVRLPDYPLSGPTVGPFGDKSVKSPWEDLSVSFLSEAFDVALDIGQAYANQQLGLTSVAPTVGTSFLPEVISEGAAAVNIGAAAAGIASSAMSLFSSGQRSNSDILADARSSRKGATKKKIVAAARHCGIPMAADMFGITESDVCQLVISPTRRRRGISAADIRRTRSTIRKVKSIQKQIRCR